MKKTMRKLLAISMTMAIMLTGIVNVGAAGSYSITVNNNTETTGMSIAGDTYNAYQILDLGDKTTYEVNPEYTIFFNNVTPTINGYDTDSKTL